MRSAARCSSMGRSARVSLSFAPASVRRLQTAHSSPAFPAERRPHRLRCAASATSLSASLMAGVQPSLLCHRVARFSSSTQHGSGGVSSFSAPRMQAAVLDASAAVPHIRREPQSQSLSHSPSSSSKEEERAEDESESESESVSSQPWRWSLFGVVRRAFRWYVAQLERRPYTVQMLTSAFLFAIGDITAQHYEAYIDRHSAAAHHPLPHPLLHHHELHPDLPPSTPFSFHRLLACTLFGLCVMGPGGHWWYTRLDQWVLPYAAPRTARSVLMKVLLDTAIFNPLFLVVFFASVSVMEGKGLAEIRRKLYRDFVPSYAVDCSVWPIVQCFNFRLVPVQLQLLVVNLFCYFDDVFLSYVQHNGMPGVFLWIERAWLSYIGEAGRDQDSSERPAIAAPNMTAEK